MEVKKGHEQDVRRMCNGDQKASTSRSFGMRRGIDWAVHRRSTEVTTVRNCERNKVLTHIV